MSTMSSTNNQEYILQNSLTTFYILYKRYIPCPEDGFVTESLAIKFAERIQVCRQFIYFLSCRVASVWHLVYRECGETPSNTKDISKYKLTLWRLVWMVLILKVYFMYSIIQKVGVVSTSSAVCQVHDACVCASCERSRTCGPSVSVVSVFLCSHRLQSMRSMSPSGCP